MRPSFIVSDLSRCQPQTRLTRDFDRSRWQLLDYESEDGVKGVMACAYPEMDCGELTLELPEEAKGPHKIFLGINYTKTVYPEWTSYGQLEVKLEGEGGFRRVGAEFPGPHTEHLPSKMGIRNEIYKSLQEAYWKTADLNGQSLVFRQPRAPYARPDLAQIVNLSYVKLAPLDEVEVEQWQRLMPTAETRRLAQIFCTDVLSGDGRGSPRYFPADESWFRDEITPYIDTDVGILVFEALRGNLALYKTRAGDIGTEDNRWREEWVDCLETCTRVCHEHGIKVFCGLRFKGPQYPMNREPIARALNYAAHPEWVARDREGYPLSKLSLAYPGARAHWLALLRETLEYGIDGVQIYLNRSNPFVMFEEPVVAAFREKYGEDPRDLPDGDERLQKHQASYVTAFLREVRALAGEKPNREVAVMVYGKPHKYDKNKEGFHPLRYNCDVEAWIEEGLVDYVMPSPYIDTALLSKWRELAGDRVHLWPDLMPRTQPGDQYVEVVRKYLAAGADGFAIWDGERRPPRISEWATVCRLGHTGMLDWLAEQARGHYRRIPLKLLDGLSVKESFHDG